MVSLLAVFAGRPNMLQGTPGNSDRIEALRIAFITQQLNLSPGEAEKFWPVYNDYQGQRNAIQIEKLKLNRNFNQNESTLSDKQLEEMGDKYVDCLVQESNLAVSFHRKLKEVLPPVKVILYYQAENQYKIQLLNELQTVRQQQRVRPGRNF
jgi:hypothetical protein